MFKKISIISCLLAASFAQANKLSDENLVTRSLTAKDGEVQLFGAIGHARSSYDKTTFIDLDGRYGITDNWTVGLGNMRYRFLEREDDTLGLELTLGGGLKGAYEVSNDDYAIGYGADLTGKYVFTEQTAFLFSSEYVFWNMPNTDQNGSEWRLSAGVQQQIMDDLVLSANYTYRDLKDFSQSSAHAASLNLTYSINKQWDVGAGVSYSDFDPIKNGFTKESAYKNGVAAFVSYRF